MNNQRIDKKINVIGAGLAGCEAAWQAANRGCEVRLYEMKPQKYSPAHHSPMFAELVCSNSLRSNVLSNAVGLLKEELLRMNSLIMEAAYACQVPAGSALAVDRVKFSEYISNKIEKHPNIEIIREELRSVPENDEINIIATGPLTSESLSESIRQFIGCDYLHFFDAAAPIVDFSSIDMSKAFYASRYNKGEASYINCPFTKEEYDRFYNALINAELAPLKQFDKELQEEPTVFEGCLPVEVIAKRGHDTLLFGPMKPVGLTDPKTGEEPYAAVQLRQENAECSMYNLVGFQTHLSFPAQREVFRMIPGLENAEFLRYGVMHRNTFLNSPGILSPDYSLKKAPNIYFAGQITGVEGYIESTSSGFVAGLNASRRAKGEKPFIFPDITAIGALSSYVSNESNSYNFQPMNVNFGIVSPLGYKVKGGKIAKNEALSARSLEYIDGIKNDIIED